MRDVFALMLIGLARRLTTKNVTDDHLSKAEREQKWIVMKDR